MDLVFLRHASRQTDRQTCRSHRNTLPNCQGQNNYITVCHFHKNGNQTLQKSHCFTSVSLSICSLSQRLVVSSFVTTYNHQNFTATALVSYHQTITAIAVFLQSSWTLFPENCPSTVACSEQLAPSRKTNCFQLTSLALTLTDICHRHRHRHHGGMSKKTPPPTELQIPANVTILFSTKQHTN